MFTGIVDHCAKITAIEKKPDSLVIWIESSFNNINVGESIAVDGICLTALDPIDGKFRCDLSHETCRLTTAMNYVQGSQVNLERSLQLSDRIGGHFVTGHVDQTLRIKNIKQINEFLIMTFDGIKDNNQRFVMNKGSITINGVSLTINSISDHLIEVALIPHTLEITNLKNLKEGDSVNAEFDWLTKIVARQIEVGAYEK